MKRLSDELLMAYHDGALPPVDAREVEAALAADAEARARLRALAETDSLVGRAFAKPMRDPLPEALLRAIDDAGPEAKPRGAARPQSNPTGVSSSRRFAFAVAASVMLLVGLAGGFGLSRWMAPPEVAFGPTGGSMFAAALDPQIERALETMASGQAVTLQTPDRLNDVRLRPVLTFVDDVGRFCREYELWGLGPDGARATAGVACRDDSGQWRSEVAVAAQALPTDGFRPASVPSGAALEAAIDALMVGGPLSLDQERELIGRQWRGG
jgi:anti-sigma-K factor RskA